MVGITFANSPIYLAGLFVLLLVVWALKLPIQRGIVSFKKWSKKKRAERKKKNHKSIVPLVMENKPKKAVKGKVKVVNRKVFVNDWSTPLFFILGIGALIYSLFGQVDFLAKAFNQLNLFVYGFINNHIFTTIILGIFVSSIFVIISDLFEYFQKRKYLAIRILSMFLFAILIALSFIVFIRAAELSSISRVNSTIFAIVFILMGLIVNYKRIFRKLEPEKKEEQEKEADEFIF